MPGRTEAGGQFDLVVHLLRDERPVDARALRNETEPPADDLCARRRWHLERALAFLQHGLLAEVRSALDAFAALGPVPAELAPSVAWRHVLLGLADGDVVHARLSAKAMENSLETMPPDVMLEHRIKAHYDLARFWSSQDDHPEAFAQWAAAHALLKPLQPFSRETHSALVEANLASFTRARFTNGERAQNTDRTPIFIVGMPRSGTALIEQILAAHPQVHGAGERSALGNTAFRLAGANNAVERLAKLDTARLDAAASAYLDDLHALAPEKTRIVDKMPCNYQHLGLVGLMLPGAKIVHCTRDPRDTGLSIFSFRFQRLHGYAHDLADLGWTIAKQERLMAHFKDALADRILTVNLSDWVEDLDGTLARVLAHVDLPHDAACTRFYEGGHSGKTGKHVRARRPVDARGLGGWRSYEAELQPLIAELDRAGCLEAWRHPSEA